MKVDLYCVVRNEAKILPFFLRYYSEFASKIVLFDDGSTDDTCQIEKLNNLVDLRNGNLGSDFDEEKLRCIKTTAYKESRGKADWVIVCDCDEFIYHKNLWGQLLAYREIGITLPRVHGFEMVSEMGLPDQAGQLPEIIKNGVLSEPYSKQAIFNPDIDINYAIGCHLCEPKGRIIVGGSLQLLHYNFLSCDYIIDRWKERKARTNVEGVKSGWKAFDWSEQELKNHHRWLLERSREVV